MKHWVPTIIGVILMAVMAAGCRSGRGGVNWTQYLKEMELQETAVLAADKGSMGSHGADSPEPPSQALSGTELEGVGGSSEVTIQPDCILQIKVAEDASLDGSYAVNEIGAVEVGYIGPIILLNKSSREAEFKIKQVLEGRNFRKATVAVRIIKASYDKVRVSGAVNKPGLLRIGAGDVVTLNDALLRAGGLRSSAKGAKVRIARAGLTKAIVSFSEMEEHSLMTDTGAPMIPNVKLRNNDILYVFSGGAKGGGPGERAIVVLGEVKKPGVYRFGDEPCTLMHLNFKMNGLPAYADKRHVLVIRRDEKRRETRIEVNLEEILEEGDPEKDLPLENGDRIVVPPRKWTWF